MIKPQKIDGLGQCLPMLVLSIHAKADATYQIKVADLPKAFPLRLQIHWEKEHTRIQ